MGCSGPRRWGPVRVPYARGRAGRLELGDDPAHRILLSEFGGITERGGEFEGQWLLNTNESLTLAEASHDATFLRDCARVFERVPGGIPIDMTAYYSISQEANGNDTLCHRVARDVMMFAQDHSFSHVVPLEGCPDYTLYRINGAPGFVEWGRSGRQAMDGRVDARPPDRGMNALRTALSWRCVGGRRLGDWSCCQDFVLSGDEQRAGAMLRTVTPVRALRTVYYVAGTSRRP